jgi:hypothetical protein
LTVQRRAYYCPPGVAKLEEWRAIGASLNREQMRIERMEEKIKTPQTPRRQSFLFIISQRLGVSALKTAFPSVQIKSALFFRLLLIKRICFVSSEFQVPG